MWDVAVPSSREAAAGEVTGAKTGGGDTDGVDTEKNSPIEP
jgi:hypothetical protein